MSSDPQNLPESPDAPGSPDPAGVVLFLLTACAGIALDLWTKALAQENLSRPRSVIRLLPGLLHLEYLRNHGAVFGIGQGWRWLFILISAAAIVFLAFLLFTSGRRHFYQFILGLLMAGVVGNLYDRLVFGYVRDMIHALPRWPGLFPYVFNLADSFLCVGVGLMFLYSLVRAKIPDR